MLAAQLCRACFCSGASWATRCVDAPRTVARTRPAARAAVGWPRRSCPCPDPPHGARRNSPYVRHRPPSLLGCLFRGGRSRLQEALRSGTSCSRCVTVGRCAVRVRGLSYCNDDMRTTAGRPRWCPNGFWDPRRERAGPGEDTRLSGQHAPTAPYAPRTPRGLQLSGLTITGGMPSFAPALAIISGGPLCSHGTTTRPRRS